jgi:DNA-binding XRE family transcriptional regulator
VKVPRLKEWRESEGLAQAALAEMAGVSEFTVCRAEHCTEARPSTARKLADSLGVSVVDLVAEPPVRVAAKLALAESVHG